MECTKGKQFILLSGLLLWLLLSSGIAAKAPGANLGGTGDAQNARSKKDLNPDTPLSSDGSDSQSDFRQSNLQRTSDEVSEEAKQKRLRDFVGKRGSIQMSSSDDVSSQSGKSFSKDDESSEKKWPTFATFRGIKRTDSSVAKRSVDKRLRDFVGKRSSYDKRLRDFVGKRDDDSEIAYAKRLRDFVGKRQSVPYQFELKKRLRDFVGKREATVYPLELQKRLRDFVGKREATVYPLEPQKRLRDFVGKREATVYPLELQKRLRDFVGKREFMPYPVELEKRLRDFVGKRESSTQALDVYKRLRDFVGKREYHPYSSDIQKRLRDFVGKRGGIPYDVQKRLRDFVGKRDSMPYSDNIQKRLRDFVGKRDASLYSSEIEKRLRDFVGKRFQESTFSLDTPMELSGYAGWRQGGDIMNNGNPSEPLELGNSQVPLEDEAYASEKQPLDLTKRAPIREFVGKRADDTEIPFVLAEGETVPLNEDVDDPAPMGGDAVLAVSKRLRDFVGKRTQFDKRLRDFVGKRDGMNRLW